jgi:hypothetical protein
MDYEFGMMDGVRDASVVGIWNLIVWNLFWILELGSLELY